eukprot:TRINITY_DN823_c0_g1_i9.p1 TRINITY_DN823_c0_g1~~TRINITY_DN823_c0_g1_i9.p1  ORF type:complete len:509 (-),score=103.34 TRINITY_DN823_c0_g1_i9:23-1498(-)
MATEQRFTESADDYFIDGSRLGRDHAPDATHPYEGVCSVVYPGRCRRDPRQERVALKMVFNIQAMQATTRTLVAKYDQDFIVLTRLPPHPNLLRVYSKFVGRIDDLRSDDHLRDLDVDAQLREQRSLFVVCELGSITLKQYMLKERDRMSALEVCAIVGSLLEALVFLGKHHVAHCDIKPDNVMRTVDGRWVLIDFGEAKDWGTAAMKDVSPFTIRYWPGLSKGGAGGVMAPEIYHTAVGEQLNYEKADVFAVGCVLCDIVLGENPFVREEHRRLVRYDIGAVLSVLPPLPQRFTVFGELLQRLLCCDPAHRLSADVALLMMNAVTAREEKLQMQRDYEEALQRMTTEMADMQSHLTRLTQQRDEARQATDAVSLRYEQQIAEREQFFNRQIAELKQQLVSESPSRRQSILYFSFQGSFQWDGVMCGLPFIRNQNTTWTIAYVHHHIWVQVVLCGCIAMDKCLCTTPQHQNCHNLCPTCSLMILHSTACHL